jgi:RimJ/RimL family protein N-acetyltransferase
MAEPVHIREARLPDVPGLLHYAHALFSERLPTLFEVEQLPSFAAEEAFARPYIENEGWLLLIALVGTPIVGVLSFKRHEHPQLQHGGEFGISVLAPWRGRGIGSRLLDALAAWAPRHGIRRLELQVFANNPAAIRLYERNGYVEEGRRRRAVRIGSLWHDVVLMARELPRTRLRDAPRSRA